MLFPLSRLPLAACFAVLVLVAPLGAQLPALATLDALGDGNNDGFGQAIHSDGARVIVGAPFSAAGGDAYIFEWNGTSWDQVAQLVPSSRNPGDWFGFAVLIDGDYAFVSAPIRPVPCPSVGIVFIFQRDAGGVWNQIQALLPQLGANCNFNANDEFGMDMDYSGGTLAVTARGDAIFGVNEFGSIYVFDFNGTDWSQTQILRGINASPFYRLGSSVAIEGDTLIGGARVASNDTGSAYVYERSGGTWSRVATLDSPAPFVNDRFGSEVGVAGNTVMVGLGTPSGPGKIFAYEKPPGGWVDTNQAALIEAMDPQGSFGRKLELELEGDTLVASSSLQDGTWGAAYIFRNLGGSWIQTAKLGDGRADDQFGFGLALRGDQVFVNGSIPIVGNPVVYGFARDVPVNPCASPPPGMVAWWQAEGTADDRRGTNHGVLEGGYRTGLVGQAFSFDFDGAEVTVPDDPILDLTDAMTVELWAKLDGPPFRGCSFLIDKSTGGDNTGWGLSVNQANGNPALRVGNGSSYTFVGSSINVFDQAYHHLVGTYDGSEIRLYVDGQLEGITPFAGPMATNDGNLYIGRLGFGGSGECFFHGLIDEISIYDRALDPSEIQGIYDALAGGKCDNFPPVADAGFDLMVECEDPLGTVVMLDGTGSFDPELDPLTFAWSAPGITFDDPTSATPTGTFPLGITTATLTVFAGAHMATDTVDVIVVDTTLPDIVCPADIEVLADAPEGTIVNFVVTSTDLCDPDPVVDCTPPSGSLFPVGLTMVDCTATDASGNMAFCSFAVIVLDDALACRKGNVNAAAGPVTDVVFVNDGVGDRVERKVSLSGGGPLKVSVVPPPSAQGADTPLVLYLWLATPTNATVQELPFGVGSICLPIPLTGGSPQPVRIANSLNHTRLLGTERWPGPSTRPAPTDLILAPVVNRAVTFFVQGLIPDTDSVHGQVAITNGLEVVIE
jgi:hypothetical protein